jgi:V/A-type H+-transporting ATPase subunit I
MFKPLAMRHVALWVLRRDAPQAALELAAWGVFNPESSKAWERDLPEQPGDRYREVYLEARARMDKIASHSGALPEPSPGRNDAPALEDLERCNAWLGELWSAASACEEEQRRLQEERQRIEQLLATLARFESLDIDLAWLARAKRFLDTQLGAVPEANVARLAEALELSGFVLEVFGRRQGQAYAVAAGPAGRGKHIRGALDAAGWQEIALAPELLAHPGEARTRLQAQAEEAEAHTDSCMARHGDTLDRANEKLAQARRVLALAEPYARLSFDTLRAQGGLALMTGWIPAREEAKLRAALDKRMADRYVLQLRPPMPSERDIVPSAMRYPGWLGPFSDLVRNYGVPRYGEFDPTWLFAVSFVLMFGMMFGDIGHGLAIAVAGLALTGRARRYRPLLLATGASAVAFGFAYGSLFGFETIVRPLWMSPLSDPERMLKAAVLWGVGFIALTQLLMIYNHAVSGRIGQALFGAGGVAGLLLYLGAVLAAARLWRGDDADAGLIVAAIGLALILAANWADNEGPWPERLLTVIIEGFEALIGFFANTLSFMRVAAFSINHVALALAVFTIAEGMQGFGRGVVLVIGNLVILLLEGAIVAIQVLRLEYYEGFSRFYSGSGRLFQPLGLAPEMRGVVNGKR